MSDFDFGELLFGLRTPKEAVYLPTVNKILLQPTSKLVSELNFERFIRLKLPTWQLWVFFLLFYQFYGRAALRWPLNGGADYAEEFLIPCQIFHKKINTTVVLIYLTEFLTHYLIIYLINFMSWWQCDMLVWVYNMIRCTSWN